MIRRVILFMNEKPLHNEKPGPLGPASAGSSSGIEPDRRERGRVARRLRSGVVACWALVLALVWAGSAGPLIADLAAFDEPANESESVASEPGSEPADAPASDLPDADDLALRLEALEQETERLSDYATQLSQGLEAMASRLERSLSGMEERADAQRHAEVELGRQIVMLEAAALLSLGQQQAELSADVDGAVAAYRRAQVVLAELDDARLDRVRRALARELDALESVRVPDPAQAMARLERLARESRAWPSQLDRPTPAEHQAEAGLEGETPDWRERIGGAARGLVRVQARDEIGRTSEQFETARELMQLRLVAAQLALTRQDPEALAVQVGAALELLDDWFEAGTDEVEQGRRDLEAIKSTRLRPDLPELGEALNLLRTRLGEV